MNLLVPDRNAISTFIAEGKPIYIRTDSFSGHHGVDNPHLYPNPLVKIYKGETALYNGHGFIWDVVNKVHFCTHTTDIITFFANCAPRRFDGYAVDLLAYDYDEVFIAKVQKFFHDIMLNGLAYCLQDHLYRRGEKRRQIEAEKKRIEDGRDKLRHVMLTCEELNKHFPKDIVKYCISEYLL